jgi:hypothetical protein
MSENKTIQGHTILYGRILSVKDKIIQLKNISNQIIDCIYHGDEIDKLLNKWEAEKEKEWALHGLATWNYENYKIEKFIVDDFYQNFDFERKSK